MRSLMSTSAMFLGGASYNNGVLPYKRYILGESYTPTGDAASIKGPLLPDPTSALVQHGVLPAWSPCLTGRSAPTGRRFPRVRARRPGDGQSLSGGRVTQSHRREFRRSTSRAVPTCMSRTVAMGRRDAFPFPC